MNLILKPIALNETSYSVNLLHRALATLGFPVAKREAAEGKAGEDTLEKVRALQARLNVPVDDSVLVNEVTSLAITGALEERGLIAASRAFTVTGSVRLQNGAVKKRQKLLAFDLDLRGVAVYRQVKSTAEIKKIGGFEFLGQAVSDSQGNYSITFYDWQYAEAERKKADVVVYAIEGENIVGRSRMVNSDDYSEKGLVSDLDVIITAEDERTEYEALMGALNAFLKENRTTLSEIAKSRDQLAFTAGELDEEQSHIDIAASAELLANQEDKRLSHELLYGIGRQNVRLSWPVLYKKKGDELLKTIAKSMEECIVGRFEGRELAAFVQAIRKHSVKYMLEDKDNESINAFNAMLKNALPDEKQRISFVNALGNFTGGDFREFWNGYLPAEPEFKDKPELISNLLLTQQLTLLAGNHQPLVKELQVNRKLTSIHQLIELEKKDWLNVIEKTGVPEFIEGKTDEEKMDKYASLMQGLLNAAFPAQRIARMVEKDELPIEKNRISKKIGTFLSKNVQFDFAGSRIHDFKKEIKEVAGDDYEEVRKELMKIQRTFQISTSPEAMTVLMENNLHSAYTIASIPRKSFIKTYGNALGGEHVAFAIHQRASHIGTRAEMAAMHLMEYSHGVTPAYALGKSEYNAAMDIIKKHMPNPTPSYVELFGSPDICECEHCRSVYSASAYFVDLLRFLWRGEPNSDGKTPLDILTVRRPDLLHLRLTCENTNTLIPYIDLAKEVMEYYTANGSLTNFEGHDTGEATTEELRANPQNFNLEAYRILSNNKVGKEAVYPFTLPYHQPLDVIRTYSDHLKVNRYEVLTAMIPEPDTAAKKAIEAESLKLSPEEYIILTGEAFDGTSDTTDLHKYFGYANAADFANMQDEIDTDGNTRGIRVLLERTGLAYTDLVELVKTRFINPHQGALDFLEKIFSYTTLNAGNIYTRLGRIEAGTLDPADDEHIVAAIIGYNSANGTSITTANFADWVTDHLDEFRQVITLYEPESKCALDTTRLRTMKSIYEGGDEISPDTWSKMHRFIRLWRKLGWTIYETDLMLAALGEDDITTETISKLESVSLLRTATKRPLNKLAVLWGNIDTCGDKSLYKQLFLNKAAQQIDEAFKADAWGNYLQRELDDNVDPITLGKHKSAILAAFRVTEEDLKAIFEVARVIDGGNPRAINVDDILNLQNLSTIYRYVVLARSLKMKIVDLCKVISLFNASPFSTWDIQQGEFTNILPENTYDFYKISASTKTAGFKPSMLEYTLRGTLPAESKIGLHGTKVLQTARSIRDAFASIEQDHPDMSESPLTTEILIAKLSLTFKPTIVSSFMRIIESTEPFETITDANLNVIIPDDDSQSMVNELVATGVVATQNEAVEFLRELSRKYAYVNGSGRLTCTGVMSDTERMVLKGLANANTNFKNAIDKLYEATDTFIGDNFKGIFSDSVGAKATLLDHPAQAKAAKLDEKILYVYDHLLPVLKDKLRKDAITKHIASLIGLSEEATALLIADYVNSLVTNLSTKGFSAAYFTDTNLSTLALERVDSTIDFSWGNSAPDPLVPADNFSVRWKAYIVPPASGEYTLVAEVEEADEAFKLYLDDTLILEKTPAAAATSLERIVNLNAARFHQLTLEYAEVAQTAGVRLRWKTVSTAPEIVPSSTAYPAAILDKFVEQATIFHRAAEFISGFGISETELDHFIKFNSDFGNIDFKVLTAEHWKRINDYMTLRNALPQAQALLTDVFALANRSDPLPTVNDLVEILRLATAWDDASLAYLVNTHFALDIDDFKNEIALNQIHKVMQIVSKTGISAQTIAGWGAVETDFDTLQSVAQLIKNTVKAKYEEKDWLDLAGNLSDKIRENQKQVVVSYLLVQPAIRNAGVEDADGLFEYFLIDVQMGACMDTSRIVQANAAIQMFVNRSLLNLESDISSGSEMGVSPEAIDKDRWEWMKNYRVWEANRKVFLYPENWLEPEWRNDRSEFFKELESYLVQNDITERSVEQGFRNYLTSLNEVANLEVCGMYQENHDDGKLKYLHVFARTHNAPYKFYYRTWNECMKWSAWEKVQVDIRSVEDGDNSGVHLIPVVWKKRLFLFWPEFMEVQESPSRDSSQSVEELSDDSIYSLHAIKYWEIRLAWSEYVNGKWSPKQVSKEFVKKHRYTSMSEKDLSFVASISPNTQELCIDILMAGCKCSNGKFQLSDIQSPVRTSSETECVGIGDLSNYSYAFSNRVANATLELLDDVYLQNTTSHRLLPSDTIKGSNITLDNPFFFSDAHRTYFVRPIDIRIIDQIKNPTYYKPFIPMVVAESGFATPVETPAYGLATYMTVEGVARGYTGGLMAFGLANCTVKNQTVMRALPGGGNDNTFTSSAVTTRSGSRATGEATGAKMVSNNYAAEMSYIEGAFGAVKEFAIKNLVAVARWDKGLEFHTFYHPFSSEYITNLNQGGLSRGNKPKEEYPPGLMESDTDILSDEGATFEDKNTYDPNFTHGLVQKPSDFDKRTYYKENVCFDVYGANSLYNWELFFHAPLYIATRLSRNGKYKEAMKWFHYIFDPTTDEMPGVGEPEISRYWKVMPFKTTPAESLEYWFRSLSPNTDSNAENAIIGAWRDNPFDPHLVASNRHLAYMKHVVVKYVENLIAWGDSLFRQFTRESVYEALQIYVIANHILGPRPEFVPKRGKIKVETYYTLKDKWDDFSNALVQLENIFPYSSEVSVGSTSTGANLLGIGSALYFCIPANDKLLGCWDTVADRLYKIRHCQDIDGVERELALFAPPISPEALIQAVSQGLSLGSILADLSSPPPIYRFPYLIQKANEFCADVKALGSALLAALEKKDAEELGRLRASHETQMLELVTAIRERQVLDAKAYKENLLKARETASFRMKHYMDLLGNESSTPPPAPTISATLTADSQLPVDTRITKIETDVDESLVDGNGSGIKLIPKEKEDMMQSQEGRDQTGKGSTLEAIGGLMNFIPNFSGNIEPFGCGMTISYGGSNIAGGMSGIARFFHGSASDSSAQAAMAAKTAAFIRREQEWTLQANLAAKEIIQLDKQITSTDIKIQVAEKELDNHKKQIEDAKEVELFLKDKFTNQELYQWMREQLMAVYKQSYNLAYDMAKKAEKAYKYEMGAKTASFIQYGYWDNSKQGLVAGEKLQLAVRQLEKSYLEENRRELELSKSISIALLNPLALIELRETGKCYVSLPEELFDLDFQGHYFRRIKLVSLSIPCIAGPYTTANCSLHLLKNTIRVSTSMNVEGTYEHENDEGVWIDDFRFRSNHVPVTSIATSTGQNDTGMFEFNFKDERYLPFEGAGAVSEWQIELSTEKELRQFDYSTISDVILHLKYTARENGGLFKKNATAYIEDFIMNTAELANQPLRRMFSMKHEFPTEWHKFLHPSAESDQILNIIIGKERMPFFTQHRKIVVMSLDVLAKTTRSGDYLFTLSVKDNDDNIMTSSQISMPQKARYGNLQMASLAGIESGIDVEAINIEKSLSFKLKHSTSTDFKSLATNPDEVKDILLVLHYKLEDAE